MQRSAVIFPGQGSQSVGMGKDVVESSASARAVFQRANEVIGFDLSSVCFEGPAAELERTDVQQPAIFVTSVALWAAFVEAGGGLKHFGRTGGLSLGEYTALHIAGAMSFDDALKLVHRRGQLMQEAANASSGGMVSLIGATPTTAAELCDRARESDVLAPANFNCPGQIVISGSKAACERALGLAEEFECRAVSLPVAGAFHSGLMEPAAAGLWDTLLQTEIKTPVIPVISNVDGEYHVDPQSIRDALRRQLTEPVRWQRCIEKMLSDGTTCFVEVGPGRVLTGLMRKIDRGVETMSVRDAASVATAIPESTAR